MAQYLYYCAMLCWYYGLWISKQNYYSEDVLNIFIIVNLISRKYLQLLISYRDYSTPHSHHQRVQREFAVRESGLHRPANHVTGEEIDNHRQIQQPCQVLILVMSCPQT